MRFAALRAGNLHAAGGFHCAADGFGSSGVYRDVTEPDTDNAAHRKIGGKQQQYGDAESRYLSESGRSSENE